MAVTDYLQKSSGVCRYNYSKLKDVIYLISEEHLKNVHIDNGEAYIDGLTELPLRINGFNIQFNEETSLDERYKFQKTLTLSMHGYVNYKIFGGRHYAIIETQDETFYMINVDFPSRITHTFNLAQNINQTDFTFACLSNFPTLKLNAEFEAVSPVCLGFNVYGIDKLQLIEKEKARLDTVNKAVISTEDFKTVEFLGNSCSFQEVYDGFKVTDTITFDIAFDNYKPSWQYNLLEFLDNRYSAIITPKGGDNKYYPGYNFGLEPSYTIQTASQNGQSDTITVTLTEASIYGSTAANDWSDDQSTDTRWRWVKFVGDTVCYECIGLGRARYLVKQQVDKFGNPTGNYQVLEGYESVYPNFNIVGTFSTEEEFTENSCNEDESCQVTSTIPNTIYFNSVTCNTYSLKASCDWRITDIPSNITVSPTTGAANTDYTVSICNTATPTQEIISNSMNLRCCMGVRVINTQTSSSASCIKPTTQTINCLAQYITLSYDGSCRPTITNIDSRLTYQIGTNTITINFPRNTTTSAITFNITATNCDCSSTPTTVTIIQDKQYEKWVEESNYICESGNSYHIERKYTGTSTSNYVRTEETRKGSLIESSDPRCTVANKWEFDGNYYCINGNKFEAIEEFHSNDYGETWQKTGNVRLGNMVEASSSFCNQTVTYKWVLNTSQWTCNAPPEYRTVSTAYTCVGYDKHYLNEYQVSYDSGTTWQTVSSSTGSLIEVNSEYCGYVETEYRWVTVQGEFACSGTTKMTKEKQQVSYDSGTTWTDTGQYRTGSTVIEYDSVDCGYEPPTEIKFRATYSGGSTYVAGCDSSTTLSSADTRPSGYSLVAMTSAEIGDCITSIGNRAFYECYSLSSITIPDSVTTIGNSVFYTCVGLSSITIPGSVTSIGSNAFESCLRLSSVTIGSGVTSIGAYAFSNCRSLTSIGIPSGVTTIGNEVFAGCSNLYYATIGSGVTSIGSGAFANCSWLGGVELHSTTPPTLGSDAFYGCDYLQQIKVPSGSVNAYKSASGWSSYSSIIVGF